MGLFAGVGWSGSVRLFFFAVLALAAQSPALAEDAINSDQSITVWGVRHPQIGKAFTATEGVVDFGKFEDRPLLRVGELAEVVPGLAATQHSGTGKANQYFLRGFNLDHGTDFSTSLDGMPINLRTHAHGQGYLDINFLIPEIMETIAYRKGPYSADAGDFSAAGSARFQTFDRLPESFVQLEAGENNWRRAVAGVNFGELGYAALDFTGDDGPWDVPEGFEKRNAFVRLNLGDFSLSGGAYHAKWNSTDQVPQRAIDAGLISPLGSIDPTDGGDTQRLFLNLSRNADDGWNGNVYVQQYRLRLDSNFTYFLDDPVNGDQFEQSEKRTIWGGSFSKEFDTQLLGRWRPRIGGETRYDDIDRVGLYKTIAGQRLSTVREDAVEELSGAIWADAQAQYGPVRISLGVRADAFDARVKSDDPLNSGSKRDSIISPKAAIALEVAKGLELYASAGSGFHSNDARGVVSTIDPVSGSAVDPAPLLVTAKGAEIGARFERRNFSVSAALWGLDLDSELVYAGDSGASEPSNASRRYGVEVLSTYTPYSWLTLDGSAAVTHARFRNVATNASYIPNAIDYVVTGGATVRFTPDVMATLTVRRLGPAPLIEDNSARGKSSTVVNGRVSWRIGRVTLALEGLNLTDSDEDDIRYFYTSRLAGEPADGVDDYHLHPVPPRSFRIQTKINF